MLWITTNNALGKETKFQNNQYIMEESNGHIEWVHLQSKHPTEQWS